MRIIWGRLFIRKHNTATEDHLPPKHVHDTAKGRNDLQNRSSLFSTVSGRHVEQPGFDSRRGNVPFFANAPRPALGLTEHSIQLVLGALSPGIKRLGCESDHSPPSSA